MGTELKDADARYWAGQGDDDEYGVADEDSPELTEEQMLWSVRTADFPSLRDASEFLKSREAFLRSAEAAGVPRATFLPFDPGKPGFEDRARKALMALPQAVGWAAE